jgi:hypothetical protein
MAYKNGHKSRNDYIRQAKKNARNRPLKKFNWKIKNSYEDFCTKKSKGNLYSLVLIHRDSNLTKAFFDIDRFNKEKEYFRRMLSGEYVDKKEPGAYTFLNEKCRYCNRQRWRHPEGKCPNIRNVRGVLPKGWKKTLDHLFTYDKSITAMVIETLVLEGFDIEKKYRIKL